MNWSTFAGIAVGWGLSKEEARNVWDHLLALGTPASFEEAYDIMAAARAQAIEKREYPATPNPMPVVQRRGSASAKGTEGGVIINQEDAAGGEDG